MTFEWPEDVRGWLHEREGTALYTLAAEKVVLEIGSYHGRSTICLAQSAARVVSVDWHQGGWGVTGNSVETFRDNLLRYRVSHNVEVHVEEIQVYGPTIPDKTFDLVFIDGNHSAPFVRHDGELARRIVKDGGVIALHDWPEVVMYISSLLPPEQTGQVETLAWFRMPERHE